MYINVVTDNKKQTLNVKQLQSGFYDFSGFPESEPTIKISLDHFRKDDGNFLDH